MTTDVEPMQFLASNGYSATITSAAIFAMRAASEDAGRRETGGILIGRYGSSGWDVEVTEATRKPKGSWAGFTWFRRGNAGLGELLRARWAEDCYYVGEWHFHPKGHPSPSGADIAAMKRTAADPIYDCPIPILLILAGDPKNRWQISATLIHAGLPLSLSILR
jgi:proteasome lid subunit RPN8/RPN11